jgi:hypothetical protein
MKHVVVVLAMALTLFGVLIALRRSSSPMIGVQRPPENTAYADDRLPGVPLGWPSTLELGVMDSPGGAASMAASAPFSFRYQYLAGGVNTGNGWATWDPDGEFVSDYIRESIAAGIIPVFTYYMIFQSAPGNSQKEPAGIYANLQNTSTMAAYFADLRLFFQRANAFANTMVVLHVEPDLWGYIQQRATIDDGATVPVQVESTGLAELAGMPDNASSLARAVVALRDAYAPNVVLAYHLSAWGTGTDMTLSDPPDGAVDTLATRSASFYRSLRSNFDLVFAEFSDRDAAFYEYQSRDGGRHWWDDEDFRRHVRFLSKFVSEADKPLVLWQIPLGNTRMQAMNNSRNHYQDNRVEWLLDDPSRSHLSEYAGAGVVAFLFGRGADGATCACDANKDGMTNPPPINGNTVPSLSADDDGGFFRQKAVEYYRAEAMLLPTDRATELETRGAPIEARSSRPAPAPQFDISTSAGAEPDSVAAGATVALVASVTSATAMAALVDVEIYDATGTKVFQRVFDDEALHPGQRQDYRFNWQPSSSGPGGAYIIKVGVFSPGWGTLLSWNDTAARVTVTAGPPLPVGY